MSPCGSLDFAQSISKKHERHVAEGGKRRRELESELSKPVAYARL